MGCRDGLHRINNQVDKHLLQLVVAATNVIRLFWCGIHKLSSVFQITNNQSQCRTQYVTHINFCHIFMRM
ncbi:Uncharacterised protein [Vibrio cholerae]|nr:Uncharacterised protein [Vibrio cholerae]